MRLIQKAHESQGVIFNGKPRHIQNNAYLDPSGGLQLGENIVISTNVIILTHDYSYTAALTAINKKPLTDIALVKPVIINNNVFIGAGVIILPGTTIGPNCIIGAGAVVKGCIPENSIVRGNPSQVVGKTEELGLSFYERFSQNEIYVDSE